MKRREFLKTLLVAGLAAVGFKAMPKISPHISDFIPTSTGEAVTSGYLALTPVETVSVSESLYQGEIGRLGGITWVEATSYSDAMRQFKPIAAEETAHWVSISDYMGRPPTLREKMLSKLERWRYAIDDWRYDIEEKFA